MIQFKVWVFRIIPFLRDQNGSARRKLRDLRLKFDNFGVYLLRIQSRILIAFQDKPTAIIPYAEFEGDGFATQHYVDFLEDKEFLSAFHSAFNGVPSWMDSKTYRGIIWRAHICTWGANHALNLKGDFVELGVWYGLLPKTVCEAFKDDPRFRARRYVLVDSWGAIPGSHSSPNYQEDIYSQVQARFKQFPNVEMIRGLVPHVLPRVTPPPLTPTSVGTDEGIAFLTIDMNGHLAERAALEYYYERLVPGAFVYFDDYGWGYEGLVETVNDFLHDKPETLLHFPSGQSIFLKV